MSTNMQPVQFMLPPVPPSPLDAARWAHTGLRKRMLYGSWEWDLRERIISRVGRARSAAWGDPDMSANPFRSLCAQVSILYDDPPTISHPTDAEAAVVLSAALEAAEVWPLMARVQRDVVGLREGLVKVDIDEETGELLVRAVTPDCVVARSARGRPSQLGSTREAVLREVGDGAPMWTWDVIDPATESYKVLSQAGEDLTVATLGAAASGEAYPYRNGAKKAVLPYAFYHAAVTSTLWDPYEMVELVDGTLNVGLLWTFWAHCVKDASWPQRYAAGWRPAASSVEGDAGAPRTVAEVDPTILLVMQMIDENATTPGLIGQWEPGADPRVLSESIMDYERRLVGYAGLSPSDVGRVSGDPRSGYALEISTSSQVKAAKKLRPQFAKGDRQLLALCAMALNRWSERHSKPMKLPESGWQIAYPSLEVELEEDPNESQEEEEDGNEEEGGSSGNRDGNRRSGRGARGEGAADR